MSEPILRLGVKSAASVLLIASGVHGAAHWHAFVDVAHFDAAHRQLMATMQAFEILPRWHVNAWTMLGAYSLCFAILLALGGALLWWMSRELPPRRLRALATAASLLLFGGTILLALLHPAPVQVSILLLAAIALGVAGVFGRVEAR